MSLGRELGLEIGQRRFRSRVDTHPTPATGGYGRRRVTLFRGSLAGLLWSARSTQVFLVRLAPTRAQGLQRRLASFDR